MVFEEYECLRSQFVILENADDFSNWKSQIVISGEDHGIAKCDTFKTIYHFGTSLKDLGKKWFAFSKMDIGAVEMLTRLEEMKA